jgi:hypothetical protein
MLPAVWEGFIIFAARLTIVYSHYFASGEERGKKNIF